MERIISAVGLFAMVGIAWLLSAHKTRVSWRVVVGGMALQFALAFLVMRTEQGNQTFEYLGDTFNALLDCVDEGSALVFGGPKSIDIEAGQPVVATTEYKDGISTSFTGFLDHYVAFKVLPTIIFFSAFMGILYHLGIVQRVVQGVAWVMQKTLGTSGAESLSAAANIFVGQTEAPLVIRPYIGSMTQSEIMSVMVGGFATIAGGVLAAYMKMGLDASHLITASVISAPAALLIAKVIQPEVEEPKTLGTVKMAVEKTATNFIEAAGNGAIDGLKLCLNVGAMLIAFTALVAVFNALLAWVCGIAALEVWTLQQITGFIFYPFAWLMGIPTQDCQVAGQLLGEKIILNEFFAFAHLGDIIKNGAPQGEEVIRLTERSQVILTYALCGFANISSIGIQLGGIGGIAPERKSDLARLAMRAMLGGTLAAFMTACIAGILL